MDKGANWLACQSAQTGGQQMNRQGYGQNRLESRRMSTDWRTDRIVERGANRRVTEQQAGR